MPDTLQRHLLLGLLALQNGFVTKEQLVTAFSLWTLDKRQTLEDILVEQQALTETVRSLLTTLVEEHLRQHGNDPERSLAAISSVPSVKTELEQLGDPDLQASLAKLPAGDIAARDPWTTMTFTGSGVKTGRFIVLRPHAQGGLGKVSVALDTELNRNVALKEILSALADDPVCQDRFIQEAEITGQLEHPGIVPVYGLGMSGDGRPYYAMRFVEGENLKTAIGAFHKLLKPQASLAGAQAIVFRNLLGRFVDVCQAVEYAHSRKVMHRDLKPENILLGTYGETLVVDWGLAKSMDAQETSRSQTGPRAVHTRSGVSSRTIDGSVIGTPAYMSPEQALGRIEELGPATDVYSLGATLYALLTGKAPFAGSNVVETLEKVRRGELERPRKFWPAMPLALEAVCMKAMTLSPQDRYLSARALGEDIEKWLADEPVSAYVEPFVTRIKRWIKRHPALSSTSAACTLLGLAAAILVAYLNGAHARELQSKNETILQQFAEIAKQKSDVEATNQELVVAKDKSERAEKDAIREKERAQSVTDFLVKSFRKSDPDRDGTKLTVYESLVRAEKEIDEQQDLDPLNKAAILTAMYESFYGLGMPAEAVSTAQRALELRSRALGVEHPSTLNSQNYLASAYYLAGKLDLALSLYASTLIAQKAKLGDDHADTLLSQNNLAMTYYSAGKFDLALPLYEATFKARQVILGEDHPSTLNSQNGLAMALSAAGKLDQALPIFESTLNASKSKLGDEHATTLTFQSNLALAYRSAGKLDLALPLLEETLKVQKSKLGDDHPDTLISQNNLASTYITADKLELALPLYEATHKALKAKLGADHPKTLASQNNLGGAYYAAGKIELALPLMEATFKALKSKLGAEHPNTLGSQNNLAAAYQSAGKLELAIPLLVEAIRLATQRQGGMPANLRRMPLKLAGMYDAAGQYDQAEIIYRSNLNEVKQQFGESDLRTAAAIVLLGDNLLHQKKFSEAEPLLIQSLEIGEKAALDDWTTAHAQSLLGAAQLGLEQLDDAEKQLADGFAGLDARRDKIPTQQRGKVLQDAAQRLVTFYEAKQNETGAATWRAKVHDLQSEYAAGAKK